MEDGICVEWKDEMRTDDKVFQFVSLQSVVCLIIYKSLIRPNY